MYSRLATLSTFLAAVQQTDAFWRLPCSAPLVSTRADPIETPGKVSPHLHTIMGGNGFDFQMTYEDTQNSTCSSCSVTKDFSNYWVPSIYYKAENGSFVDVEQAGGALIYYIQRSDPKDPEYASGLLAFPEGFQMLAGDPTLRSFNETSIAQQAVSFACLGTTGAETNAFPSNPCPLGIRAQIFFPSCWDGVNLDSPDHRSHMAYPSIYNAGNCPASHPKRFISLFYEVIWQTQDFSSMWYGSGQPFVLSTGDPTGYGYHGDFINGWDVPVLQKAVDTCTDMSGVIEDCAVFDFFNNTMTENCKVLLQIDETTTGVLAELPGCNPIQSGPAKAVSHNDCGATTTISTPVVDFEDLTAEGYSYLGCGFDPSGSSTRTLTGTSLMNQPNMTNAVCTTFCTGKGFEVSGTEFGNQCFCGHAIPGDRAPSSDLVGNCVTPCAGDAKSMCGNAGLMSLYRKCGAGTACMNAKIGGKTVSSDESGSSKIHSVVSAVSAVFSRQGISLSSSSSGVRPAGVSNPSSSSIADTALPIVTPFVVHSTYSSTLITSTISPRTSPATTSTISPSYSAKQTAKNSRSLRPLSGSRPLSTFTTLSTSIISTKSGIPSFSKLTSTLQSSVLSGGALTTTTKAASRTESVIVVTPFTTA